MADLHHILDRFPPHHLAHPGFELADRRQSKRLCLGRFLALCTLALILNWFRAKKQYNACIVEGSNANAKLRFRKAYGFRTLDAMQVALYHQLGHLPEPPITHKFC